MVRPLAVSGMFLGLALQAFAQPASATLVVRVVSTDGRSVPLRDVTVSIVGTAIISQRVTDDRGLVRFVDLAADRYQVRASKPGYLTTERGSLEVGGNGSALALGDSAEAEVTLGLPRAGSISGTVTDSVGVPAPDVLVTVSAESGVLTQVWTDIRGHYRFHTVGPGRYTISVTPPGGLARFVQPAEVLSEARVDLLLSSLRERGPGGVDNQRDSSLAFGMPTVYYPGSVDPSGAAGINVTQGQDVILSTIALVMGGTSRISGRLIGLDRPIAVGSRLLAVHDDSQVTYGGSITEDGSFTFGNVPSGSFSIRVRILAGGTDGEAAGLALWGHDVVRVSGGDVRDAVVALKPPIDVRGVVVRAVRDPVVPVVGVEVTLRRVARLPEAPVRATVSGDDGSFTVAGVEPGVYTIDVESGDGKWTLLSAVAGQRDLAAPFEIAATDSDLTRLRVEVSSAVTELVGRVVDPEGEPAPMYHVLAFPKDRRQWIAGSRRLAVARPDTDGSYRLRGLPEGEYYVAALTLLPDDWQGSGVLAQASVRAVSIVVEHGRVTTLDLRIERR